MRKTVVFLISFFCFAVILSFSSVAEPISNNHGETTKTLSKDVGDCSGLATGESWVMAYKVTLYESTADVPEKTNGLNGFERINSKIYFNKQPNTKGYIAPGDKFYYASAYKNGDNKIRYTTLNTIEYQVNTGVPRIKMAEETAAPVIKKYFEENNGSFVRDLVFGRTTMSVDEYIENETWLLIVEPIVACKIPARKVSVYGSKVYYLTATEFALSYDKTTKNDGLVLDGGFYNPYYSLTHTETGFGGNPGLYSINGVCKFRIADRTWLDLDDGKYNPYNPSWGDYNNTKANWSNVKKEIIFYGGAGYWFSKAFDYPDYTVKMEEIGPELWENQTITVRAKIENSNSARGGLVRATLQYNKGNITFVEGSSQTQEIDMNGRSAYEVKWTINVGTYDQTISSDEDRKRSFYVTVEAVPENNKPTELITNNNKTEIKSFHLKRDFSVQNLTVNGQTVTEVKEKTDVIVRFSIANNNPYKGYDGVKVRVKIQRPNGTKELASKTVSFVAGQTKNCELLVNVGNVTANSDQMFTISAEINYNGAWHEPNMSNNITNENKYGKIIVTRDINFAMKIIAGTEIGAEKQKYSNNNAGLTTGGRTTGMVTCVIKNISGFNMYAANESKDRLYAEVYSPVNKRSSTVCVPANGTNITWFKFTVPNSTSVTFTGRLIWIYEAIGSYTDSEGNVHTYTYDVIKYFSATPDTAGINNVTVNAPDDTGLVKGSEQLVQTDSSEYSSASAYVANRAGYPRVARWEQWKMNGHTFVLHRYALAGEVKRAVMTPANFGQDTEYVNSNGQIASGSAFTLDFQYDVMTESSRGDAVSPSAYTLVQNGIARFPEFKYQLGNKKTRTLFFKNDSIDSKTMFFNTNQYADDVNGGGATPENHIGQRVHFTPLNMPDGKYKVAVEAYDLWTPAGMIYVISTPSLEISGSIFDYNYMN